MRYLGKTSDRMKIKIKPASQPTFLSTLNIFPAKNVFYTKWIFPSLPAIETASKDWFVSKDKNPISQI